MDSIPHELTLLFWFICDVTPFSSYPNIYLTGQPVNNNWYTHLEKANLWSVDMLRSSHCDVQVVALTV